jgi:hypothetical protein
MRRLNRIENLSKASYSDLISSDTLILLFYKNILSDDLYNNNMSNYNKQYSKKKGYFNKEENSLIKTKKSSTFVRMFSKP